MANVNKDPEKYIVLENDTGGRAALAVPKEFSSGIIFRQVYSNGELTFERMNQNILTESELDKYKTVECESKEAAHHMVDKGLQDDCLQGSSDILSR